ncbi:sugar ABC transporter permease [Nakamurella flavida]|uniref:Sugar ABC transporter permease n=1 Tax=Nakamurella flavida TaxID=363630 RepID=A0A938YNB2_9ACTN|nr:sugar ABC transporter permease [Nakamurella flavida]MBM9477873.1 sugar ABC transporter permease [Nakamurella flavida]MDP9778413.1 multiple sugar transport system permease protein [Nakamurella flavida]
MSVTTAPPAPASEAPAPRRRGSRRRRVHWIAYALALPILAYESIFVLYPIVQGVQLSFTDAKLGAQQTTSVGLDNYDRLLSDPNFIKNVTTTLTYALGVVVVAVGCGLLTALLVNRKMRGRGLVRGLLMAPWAFPEIATVLIFIWVLNPTFGVVRLLTPWQDSGDGWLTSNPLAMFSIVLIATWKTFPFYSIVLLASLQNVPEQLQEAAKVDGATALQRFWHVTLPAIRPDLVLLALLAFIFAFRQFTLIWLTTGGGPGRDTETLVVAIYNTAFRFFDRSYGATLGVGSLIITLVVTLGFLAVQRRLDGRR